MKFKNLMTTAAAGAGITLLAPFAAMASTTPLAVSCSATATPTSITWTASSSGGVSPVTYLWGNGATSTTQTLPYMAGTYSMSLQATDASSTIATTNCSATVTATTSTSGSTSTSTASLIQSLLAQIAALKHQLATLLGTAFSDTTGTTTASSTVSGSVGCPVLNRDLGEGDHGDDVTEMQQFLSQVDPSFSAANITGFFGPLTLQAMTRFQENNDIASTSTGFVGPLTRSFVGKHCGEIEGEGHIKGTSHSWMDATTSVSTSASTTFGGVPGLNILNGLKNLPLFGNHHGEDNGNDNSSDN